MRTPAIFSAILLAVGEAQSNTSFSAVSLTVGEAQSNTSMAVQPLDEVNCGNGNSCRLGQTCMTTKPNAGLRFGCSPVEKATPTLDPRWSCPFEHTYNLEADTCISDDDASRTTQPVMNVDARAPRTAVAHDLCSITKTLLYYVCTCTTTPN